MNAGYAIVAEMLLCMIFFPGVTFTTLCCYCSYFVVTAL